MKLLVCSDVHANINALQALEKEEKNWDALWYLGDMVDYGFFPHETIAWMKEHNAVCVRGNHDTHLIELWDSGASFPPPAEAKRFDEYNLAKMTEDDIEYLREMPNDRVETADGIPYLLQHSFKDCYAADNQQSLLQEMVDFRAASAFEDVWAEKVGAANIGDPRRIIYGHTHQCISYYVRYNAMFLNPGSLSYRVGRDTAHSKGGSYMVIEDGIVRQNFFRYESESLLKLAEESALEGNERKNAFFFYEPEIL